MTTTLFVLGLEALTPRYVGRLEIFHSEISNQFPLLGFEKQYYRRNSKIIKGIHQVLSIIAEFSY